MGRKFVLCPVTALLLLMLGTFAIHTAAAPQAIKTVETKGVAKKCLTCHGSYDALAEKTSKFQASSGETVTPHQYVPHAEKTDIPDCTECHIEHPVPLEDKSKVVKPKNLDWCYSSCHHANNLQPCKTCH
jgi:hypothetical protein